MIQDYRLLNWMTNIELNRISSRADAIQVLRQSNINRLTYWIAKEHIGEFALFPDIVECLRIVAKRGDYLIDQRNRTFKLIGEIADNNKMDYVIAKYERLYSYIASDIDLFIKEQDWNTWMRSFKEKNFYISRHPEFLNHRINQRTVTKENFLKIDLTVQFGWQNQSYFDNRFLWTHADARKHRFDPTAELLVNIGAILFKRLYINLLDYLYLRKLANNPLVDWDKIDDQAVKYHWQEALRIFKLKLNGICESEGPFPVWFSILESNQIFLEKVSNRSFSYNSYLYFLLSRIKHFVVPSYIPYFTRWLDNPCLVSLK